MFLFQKRDLFCLTKKKKKKKKKKEEKKFNFTPTPINFSNNKKKTT